MEFNENSRVKVPALLHFLRLGYKYQNKSIANIDKRNNIFKNIFKENINKINNKDYDNEKIEEIIKDIALLTDNDKDKGKHFFERLVNYNKVKLIDLKEPGNNDFRVVSELRFGKNKKHFIPDITILINGIPLGFIEVKKPNNRDGLKSEFDRMKDRQKEKKFTHFFNQFQILAFSNNTAYNDDSLKKLFGSYYTTPNFENIYYNNFREENKINVSNYIDDRKINYVLKDNNIIDIKKDNEFKTNLDTETYTNRFITSIFNKERLIFFIRYGITYVDSQRDGLDKHIIRYPQFFAIKNIVDKIKDGMKRGIIWHTQGSGKTALAYFATNVLRDHYQKQNIVTKFYFVVDRLDLLNQASDEFKYRGMELANIDSKEDFVENIKSPEIVLDSSGVKNYKGTMNVVNIQKFSEDSTVPINAKENIQRIYFLDEVHRNYKPKGTFLANLLGADPDGIFIGLTGTPLLKEDFKSIDIFDQYIHKYYYNKSIADGYTLKIKKENIATYFKKSVRKALDMEEKEEIPSKYWNEITKRDHFVEEFCNYIIDDFNNFIKLRKDYSLGFMIVTSCSEQARKINDWFDNNSEHLDAALVLYDEDNNKEKQNGFRGVKNENGDGLNTKYEGVIVYSMLLTGFDAPRLKRLYLLREIGNHNLLQTLARVNRPYNNMKYGYVVDFVDITEEYEKTNRRYIKELQKEIGDEDDPTKVEDMFIDIEYVKKDIRHIENNLISYMANIENNLEKFRKQLTYLNEDELLEIRLNIEKYKEDYNELRMSHEDVSDIPIERLKKAYFEVDNRIKIKRSEKRIEDNDSDISDIDIEDFLIEFIKKGEMFLEFESKEELLEKINKTRNSFIENNDKKDKKYQELNKEFKELLNKLKSKENTTSDRKKILKQLNELNRKIKVLNSKNSGLTNIYRGDSKYMRIHKRIKEFYENDFSDIEIKEFMNKMINEIEEKINKTSNNIKEEIFIRRLIRPAKKGLEDMGINVSIRMTKNLLQLFIDELLE